MEEVERMRQEAASKREEIKRMEEEAQQRRVMPVDDSKIVDQMFGFLPEREPTEGVDGGTDDFDGGRDYVDGGRDYADGGTCEVRTHAYLDSNMCTAINCKPTGL